MSPKGRPEGEYRSAQREGTPVSELELRGAVIATALAMNDAGINRGKSGNVSARLQSGGFDGFLVTPSALPYAQTTPADIVAVSLGGEAHGPRPPSSEWRFHRDIYTHREDAQAVVHAHSPFATSLACLRRGIPAFHYMVAVAGGNDIRCAPYATFGTQALSDNVVAALAGRTACLMANHGLVAIGSSLDAALALAVEVETLAQMYWSALQAGEPVLLSDTEMEVVLAKFASYGRA
jgi:L-fuculose-phosphate aldolase